MDSKVFEAALQRTAKTWKTYMTAICVLYLTLLIDALSGLSFLKGDHAIDLAGFKVVRESLSATYGILFALFVAATFFESSLLKSRASASDLSKADLSVTLDLWFLSPFSDLSILRKVFWLLFMDGFCFLALFSLAHLTLFAPPDPHRMSPGMYRAIGVVDLVILIACIPFGYRTYQNLQSVRTKLLVGSA